MSKQTKYALFSYNSDNIGDEIQSIAAKRFLPQVDYYIDRDSINNAKFGKNETIKIIMNGWCLGHKTHLSQSYDWPPQSSQLDPLLISMHLRQDDKNLVKTFSSKESVEYFKKHSPVGARDIATLNFLKSLNIPAYFSGCLTLTLIPSPAIKKQDYVLAVDVSDEIVQAIKKRTNRPIIDLSVYRPVNFNNHEKHILAQYWLYLYQSAHCVVTRRLHTILPSIALGTPVVAIEQNSDRDRYEGLIDLANHYSATDFIKTDISIDRPLSTPPHYKKIRDQLVATCSSYTGYDSKQPSFSADKVSKFLQSPEFINVLTKLSKNAYYAELDNVDFIKNHVGIKRSLIDSGKLIASTSKKLVNRAVGLDKR